MRPAPAAIALTMMLASGFQPPGRGFPLVGAITVDGRITCSGTFIGRRTVLTSAHCVPPEAQGRLRFELPGPRRGWANASGQALLVAHGRTHPGFDLSNPRNPRHDVGILVLASCAPVEPAPLAEGRIEPGDLGRDLEWIGYGAGHRRSLSFALSLVGDDWIFSDSSDGRAVQLRDSGGPVVMHGRGGPRLLGIVHGSDRQRRRGGVAIRLDTNLNWILAQLAQAERGCHERGTDLAPERNKRAR